MKFVFEFLSGFVMQLVFITLSLDPPIVCNQGDHYVATTTNQFLQCGHE